MNEHSTAAFTALIMVFACAVCVGMARRRPEHRVPIILMWGVFLAVCGVMQIGYARNYMARPDGVWGGIMIAGLILVFVLSCVWAVRVATAPAPAAAAGASMSAPANPPSGSGYVPPRASTTPVKPVWGRRRFRPASRYAGYRRVERGT